MKYIAALGLIGPLMIAALGTGLLWFPSRHRVQARILHARRIAELEAGGEEAYFEELRSLKAYRPARNILMWQLMGAVLILSSALQFYALLSN